MNVYKLSQSVLKDTFSCYTFLKEKKLIPEAPNCTVCGDVMKTTIKGANQVIYRCQKRSDKHDITINGLKNTFFEHSKFGLTNIVLLMYFFSTNQTNYDFLIRECTTGESNPSRKTIADWISFCREVCFVWIDEQFDTEDLLGGPGVVVEVDECKIGKRKFNKGRLVEGTWVLGLIEINTEVDSKKRERRGGRYRLEICPGNCRSADVLIPLIHKHVKPNTTIVTDLWKGYFNLSGEGLDHFTVNHSTNFVDPTTSANTQTVESSWRSLKRSLKSGIRAENLADHLAEYLYRRDVKISGGDPFDHFLGAVQKLYPGIST